MEPRPHIDIWSYKKEVTTAATLIYYDSSKPLTLQTNTRLKVLMQSSYKRATLCISPAKVSHHTKKPVLQLSFKHLQSLGPWWNFTVFWLTKKFQLETVQKPIENVLAKSVTQAAPRLPCLLRRTLTYDFMSNASRDQTTNQQIACPHLDH